MCVRVPGGRVVSTAARFEPFFEVAFSSLFPWLILRALVLALMSVDDFAVRFDGQHFAVGQSDRLQRRGGLLLHITPLPRSPTPMFFQTLTHFLGLGGFLFVYIYDCP